MKIISNTEIEQQLNAGIDRWAPGGDMEKVARKTAHVLVPEVRKMLLDQHRAEKKEEWPATS